MSGFDIPMVRIRIFVVAVLVAFTGACSRREPEAPKPSPPLSVQLFRVT